MYALRSRIKKINIGEWGNSNGVGWGKGMASWKGVFPGRNAGPKVDGLWDLSQYFCPVVTAITQRSTGWFARIHNGTKTGNFWTKMGFTTNRS